MNEKKKCCFYNGKLYKIVSLLLVACLIIQFSIISEAPEAFAKSDGSEDKVSILTDPLKECPFFTEVKIYKKNGENFGNSIASFSEGLDNTCLLVDKKKLIGVECFFEVKDTYLNELMSLSGSDLTCVSGSALMSVSGSALTSVSRSALMPVSGSALTSVSGSALTCVSDSALTPVSDSALTSVSGSALMPVSDSALTPVSDSALMPISGSALTCVSRSALTSVSGSALAYDYILH